MMKSLTSLSLAALVGLTAAAASATDFEISTSPLSTASYTSDADLETISGTSVQVSGTIATDLKDPSKTSGSFSIPVTSLLSGVPMRDEHMAGEQWLNAAEFPNITFAIIPIKHDMKTHMACAATTASTPSLKQPVLPSFFKPFFKRFKRSEIASLNSTLSRSLIRLALKRSAST
jgi:polyisoprenoid-binding protein YceI